VKAVFLDKTVNIEESAMEEEIDRDKKRLSVNWLGFTLGLHDQVPYFYRMETLLENAGNSSKLPAD
jgi:hypothetical protein